MCVRRRTASPGSRASNSGASGSAPSPRSRGWSASAPARRQIHEAEPSRIVVGDDRAVIEDAGRRDRASDPSSAREGNRPESKPPPFSIRNEPDMPRCAIRVSPLSSSKRRYLARRPRSTIRRPLSRALERGGKGKTDVGPPQFDPLDAGADHRGHESAPYGLDLGQFRHGRGPGSRRERLNRIFAA